MFFNIALDVFNFEPFSADDFHYGSRKVFEKTPFQAQKEKIMRWLIRYLHISTSGNDYLKDTLFLIELSRNLGLFYINRTNGSVETGLAYI